MLNKIFPKTADNNYSGSKIALYMFILLLFVSIIRSCIHLLAPDGGAGSIEGIDLANGGAKSIIFAFGLLGLSQVIYAFIQFLLRPRATLQ
jgi:hypothetical protein